MTFDLRPDTKNLNDKIRYVLKNNIVLMPSGLPVTVVAMFILTNYFLFYFNKLFILIKLQRMCS